MELENRAGDVHMAGAVEGRWSQRQKQVTASGDNSAAPGREYDIKINATCGGRGALRGGARLLCRAR